MGWQWATVERLRQEEQEAREQLAKARGRKRRIVAERRLAAVLIELGNRHLPPSE